MYQDYEILDIEEEEIKIGWNEYFSKPTFYEFVDSLNTAKIKVLILGSSLNFIKHEEYCKLINDLSSSFPLLEHITLDLCNNNLKFVKDVLNIPKLIIDIRNNSLCYSKENFEIINDLKHERVLLFRCEDCRNNYFSDNPNIYENFGHKHLSCYSCYQKNCEEILKYEEDVWPTINIDNAFNLYWHAQQSKDQFTRQKFKTKIYDIIDNISDITINSLYRDIMDKKHPEYKPMTKQEFKRIVIKYLKNYDIENKTGPILNLFGEHEANGWYMVKLNNFYHRHKIFTMGDETVSHEEKISISSLNLMTEKYQYFKCDCRK